MVLSDKYYKSRAVGVTSEVDLTIAWDIAELNVLRKRDVVYTSAIPEVTWYELLYNNEEYIIIKDENFLIRSNKVSQCQNLFVEFLVDFWQKWPDLFGSDFY